MPTIESRPHGRATYITDQCRCEHCRKALRDYERWRHRQRAYGRVPFVDAEPARRHVRALQAANMGTHQIARVSGVPHGTLSALLYGDSTRSHPPSRRIRLRTARALLAVHASLHTLAGTAPIDGTGTRRRLQSLVALGWTQAQLADQMGMDPSNLRRLLRGTGAVSVSTAHAARALYDQFWDQHPPETTYRERIAATTARRHAQEHQWPPPMAWDDATLDDPEATPEGAATGESAGKPGDLPPTEELRFLLSCGESIATLAARFHVREKTIQKRLGGDRDVC